MSAGVGKRQVRSTIAALCDISPQAVQQWFSGGTKSPKPEHMAAVAREYDGNLMWIILGKGPMRITPATRQASEIQELFEQLPAESKTRILRALKKEIAG